MLRFEGGAFSNRFLLDSFVSRSHLILTTKS